MHANLVKYSPYSYMHKHMLIVTFDQKIIAKADFVKPGMHQPVAGAHLVS